MTSVLITVAVSDPDPGTSRTAELRRQIAKDLVGLPLNAGSSLNRMPGFSRIVQTRPSALIWGTLSGVLGRTFAGVARESNSYSASKMAGDPRRIQVSALLRIEARHVRARG